MTRWLYVHAHPDDESLWTGVAIAHQVAAGDDVHILTCTLGEEGEVIPPDLVHLAHAPGDPLGSVRAAELAAAVRELGATGHVLGADPLTGAASGWRDSGMVGSAAYAHPRAFASSPLEEVAAAVGEVLDNVAPDVVVTYDARGGYLHPDHIRAHDATCAAIAALTRRPRLYATINPTSWAAEDRIWLQRNAICPPEITISEAGDDYFPLDVDDAFTAYTVVDPDAGTRQQEALHQHRTQVIVGEGWYALENFIAWRLSGREAYAAMDADTGRLVPA